MSSPGVTEQKKYDASTDELTSHTPVSLKKKKRERELAFAGAAKVKKEQREKKKKSIVQLVVSFIKQRAERKAKMNECA